MNKINFVNGTTPALNSTNLNKLQDNVEDAIQEVQDDVDTKLTSNNIKITQTTSDTDTYGCNYINGIIESGSNANGDWTKYIDGTMICYGKIAVTSARNTSWGSLYVTSKQTGNVYPQEFYSIKSINLCAEASNNSVWVVSSELGSNTDLPSFYLASATSLANSDTYYVNYIAIGKWK